MKKSTLLSLLTTAAIITTTAGTYAFWDSTTDSTDSTITFSQPVSLEVNDHYTLSEKKSERTLGSIPSASGDVTFTINNNTVFNDKQLANQLKITPSISGVGVGINDFTIEIIDKNEGETPLTQVKSPNKDNSIYFIDETITSTEYNVKLTPVNKNSAGQAVTLTLNGELQNNIK